MQCSISDDYGVHLGESTKSDHCRRKVQADELLFWSGLANDRWRHPFTLMASVSGFTMKPCQLNPVFCHQITHPLVADLA